MLWFISPPMSSVVWVFVRPPSVWTSIRRGSFLPPMRPLDDSCVWLSVSQERKWSKLTYNQLLKIVRISEIPIECRKKSGVTLVFTWFTPRLVKKNSRHSPNQSEARISPISTWSPAFSHSSGGLPLSTLSSLWLFWIFSILIPLQLLWFWFYDTHLKRALRAHKSLSITLKYLAFVNNLHEDVYKRSWGRNGILLSYNALQ